MDREDQGVPNFDFAICAPEPWAGPDQPAGLSPSRYPRASTGWLDADLICLPAMPRDDPVPACVIEALRRPYERGARLLSVCAGAFVLGEAGLLDDRFCTTHWRYVDELEARYPQAKVRCDVLYVDDGSIITSAGSAAGLDACLHIIRSEFGASVAATVARRMVVAPTATADRPSSSSRRCR